MLGHLSKVDKYPLANMNIVVLGEKTMYRCIVRGKNLNWQWTPVGGQREDYVILYLIPLQIPRITTLMFGDVEVIFNITEFSMSSTITSVATVNNPELLNGTVMSCGGQSLTIEVPGRSKLILLAYASSDCNCVLLQVLCLLR